MFKIVQFILSIFSILLINFSNTAQHQLDSDYQNFELICILNYPTFDKNELNLKKFRSVFFLI